MKQNTFIVTIFILSLQLMDLFRWIHSSVACMGDPYSLEVRVILACELHYSPSFIYDWAGTLQNWKLQIANCNMFSVYTILITKHWWVSILIVHRGSCPVTIWARTMRLCPVLLKSNLFWDQNLNIPTLTTNVQGHSMINKVLSIITNK